MPQEVLAGFDTFWREAGLNAGPDQTPACFLHCSLAHSKAWLPLMAQFDGDLAMVAMDLPGHGRSGPWDPAVTWQRQSTDMAIALLEKADAPSHIIGHSFGGTVALRLGLERPDLVKSLTLIEPVLFSAAKDIGHPEFARHLAEADEMSELLRTGAEAELTQIFSEIWGGGTSWTQLPEAQKTYMIDRIGVVLSAGEGLFGQGCSYMPLSALKAITAPSLLIEGDQSHEIIDAIQEALSETLPNNSRVVIKGTGHMVPLTHSVEVAKHLRQFWRL